MNESWVFFKFILISLLLQIYSLSSFSLTIKQQKGAMLYMEYCSGCHTLRYLPSQFKIYPQRLDKVGLTAQDAEKWFGVMPKDLSLIVREHGESWVSNYLRSFYIDKKRPFGVNNFMFKDVLMPNVLEPLQGDLALNNKQFAESVESLVSFLDYVADPLKSERHKMGLVFILILCSLLLVLLKIFLG